MFSHLLLQIDAVVNIELERCRVPAMIPADAVPVDGAVVLALVEDRQVGQHHRLRGEDLARIVHVDVRDHLKEDR